MRSCILCVVLFMGCNAYSIFDQMGLREGQVCHTAGNQVWTCMGELPCNTLEKLLLGYGVLRTCSFNFLSRIVCCPPSPYAIPQDYARSAIAPEPQRLVTTPQPQQLVTTPQPQRLVTTPQPQRLVTTLKPESLITTPKPESSSIPPPPKSTQFGISKSQKMCTEYSNSLCGSQSRDDHISFENKPPGTLQESNPEMGTPRVTGGRPVSPGEIPSVAAIGYGDANNISWECAGSLISRNFVLGAAHCVDTSYGLPRWVRLGGVDLSSDTEEGRPQVLEIVERVVHPSYRSSLNYHDLALFKVDRDVQFYNFVRPACLHSDIGDPSGYGTVAGWGKTASHGPKSSKLMQVDIKFVPSEECKRIYGINRYIPNGVNTNEMVCAGEYGKDTCQGDSGGPLLLPTTSRSTSNCLASLVGVTSFGPRSCGVTEVPGVFVRVAHFRPWIESIVWPD